jgi:hypothetical protein
MFIESGGKTRGRILGALLGRFRTAVIRWNRMQWQDTVEAVARELNLPTAELDALLLSSSGSPLSLSLRLSHAGICEDELAANHGEILHELRRVCSQCALHARCARDLKHERRATPAKYCPNEQTLRALSDTQQGTSKILPFAPNWDAKAS